MNKQLQDLLHNAFFSDSMIADKLLQRQRTEVEDDQEGLNNIGCDEVILKGVLLTEVPNVANPMAHVLKSLTNKLDVAGEMGYLTRSVLILNLQETCLAFVVLLRLNKARRSVVSEES